MNSLKPLDLDSPRAMAEHFENQIPMDKLDFQEQVYRITVHCLFIAVISQFSKEEPYTRIKKEIIAQISGGYYQKAISNCRFSIFAWKRQIARVSLKYHLVGVMYIYYRYLCYKRNKLFQNEKNK